MSEAAKAGRIGAGSPWRISSATNRARILAKNLAAARERRHFERQPSVAVRQAELVTFYERYERLVETLCDAAQYGPVAKLQRAYIEDRAWFSEHYPSLRPYVDAFLPEEEPNAFEALFASEDLEQFLAEDDGSVIYRITATREALSLYAEHLRQLAARKAG